MATANDYRGGFSHDTLTVVVNADPHIINQIPDTILQLNELKSYYLEHFVSDNEPIRFNLLVQNNKVHAVLKNEILDITAQDTGLCQIDLLINDGLGGAAILTWTILVVDSTGLLPLSNANNWLNSIAIYPVPASSKIIITYSLTQPEENITIQLIDISGQVKHILFSGTQQAGTQYVPVTIEPVIRGVHLLLFTSNAQKRLTTKIVLE
jgi:hypothetical protein